MKVWDFFFCSAYCAAESWTKASNWSQTVVVLDFNHTEVFSNTFLSSALLYCFHAEPHVSLDPPDEESVHSNQSNSIKSS